MPTENEKSLSDEATFDGGMQADEKDLQSLGDRSTLGGSDGSSISDLGSIGDLPDHDMEIVDLSKRYRMEKSLGKGGMGEVLLATDTRLDRQVAIKRIRGDVAVGKTAAARFLTEAKAVASLSHNNIVGVYDYGRDSDGPFLIMEYVSGGSLLQRCKKGPIDLEQAIELACQLCDGLGRAHDAGIIHRDIKPANILLTDDGIPKLTDFGLAKADSRDHTMTMAGAVLGTLDFMPPEQRQDASLTDSRSDLWSLAASLYQMVTGESPKVIRLKRVPEQIRDVLDKALEETKEERYQFASELKAALEGSVNGAAHSPQIVTDLDAGQCGACGVINPSGRKFCKECAATLVVSCMNCRTTIPIWEKVCGECGCNQRDTVNAIEKKRELSRTEAEKLLAVCDFEEAQAILTALLKVDDPRITKLDDWLRAFPEEIELHRTKELERTGNLLAEALVHEAKSDYSSAIKSLAMVPDPMRNIALTNHPETVGSALHRIGGKINELERIEELIIGKDHHSDWYELLPEINRALELKPNDSKFIKLKTKIEDRKSRLESEKNECIQICRKLVADDEYSKAIKLLSQIHPSFVDDEVQKLLEDAETKLENQEQVREERRRFRSEFHREFQKLFSEARYSECQEMLGDPELNMKLDESNISEYKAQVAEAAAKHDKAIIDAKQFMAMLQYAACRSVLVDYDSELSLPETNDLFIECCIRESLKYENDELYTEAINALDRIPKSKVSGYLGDFVTKSIGLTNCKISELASRMHAQLKFQKEISSDRKLQKQRTKLIAEIDDAIARGQSKNFDEAHNLTCNYGERIKRLGLRDYAVERKYNQLTKRFPDQAAGVPRSRFDGCAKEFLVVLYALCLPVFFYIGGIYFGLGALLVGLGGIIFTVGSSKSRGPIKFKCSNCGTKYRAKRSEVGDNFTCERCREVTQVPGTPS